MTNELTVVQTLANVGQSLMSIAASAKNMKSLRKQELVILEENIRYLKKVCRARGIAELTRLCIDEMEATLKNIQQKKLTGVMLDMAMEMLKLQYEELCRIIQHYSSH